MKNIKQLSLLALLVGLVVPNGTFASGNEEKDKDKKTVSQKVIREAARVVGQVEEAGKNAEIGWKEQRKKDKKKQKEEKAQRKAQENK